MDNAGPKGSVLITNRVVVDIPHRQNFFKSLELFSISIESIGSSADAAIEIAVWIDPSKSMILTMQFPFTTSSI